MTADRGAGAAVGLIRRAFEAGRPIVPIFGAGISVGASIPHGVLLTDYLVGVARLVEIETGAAWNAKAFKAFLQRRGWPSRHHVRAALVDDEDDPDVLEGRLEELRSRLNLSSLLGEIKKTHPSVAKIYAPPGEHWRRLLVH